MVELKPELIIELGECMKVTSDVLGELSQIGYSHYFPKKIIFKKTNNPFWLDNLTITLDPNCGNARCIAHEMGHGLHYWLRQNLGYEDEYGQESAEAVRWFVEERMGNREWTPHSDWLAVLECCNYSFQEFKDLLKSEDLFRALSWDNAP